MTTPSLSIIMPEIYGIRVNLVFHIVTLVSRVLVLKQNITTLRPSHFHRSSAAVEPESQHMMKYARKY
jgi:hypothetical protein